MGIVGRGLHPLHFLAQPAFPQRRTNAGETCATPEARVAFFNTFGWPKPDNICPDNFTIEPFELERGIVLDDWKDGQPDAWDYEQVVKDNQVTVDWDDTLVDGDGNKTPAGEFAGWGLYWKNGTIHIGRTAETIARKAAALFVSLWLRGVSASFADTLMDGHICFLERQENRSLTFLAEIDTGDMTGWRYFRFTREGFCEHEPFGDMSSGQDLEQRTIEALDPQPDEEIIVTFTKRKKQP